MSDHDRHDSGPPSGASGASPVLESMRSALWEVDESERYRMLASLLLELAGQSEGGSKRREGLSRDELESLSRKAQALDEQRASLDDALKTTKADLARAQKQLEAEQARGTELQGIIDDQRSRLDSLPKELANLEAELVAKNAELHKLEVKNDELTLKAQRAELATQDQSKVDALQEAKGKLGTEIEQLKTQMDQLRLDKDAEIAALEAKLLGSQEVASRGGDALLADLWARLASGDPPLVDGQVPPNVKAAERLIDAFQVLMRFVDGVDKGMRPFLGRFTKDHASVKVPWDAFARGDDLYTIAERTLAPEHGRPVGVLNMRLRLLYSWIHAAILGCDSAIESVASELHSHLREPETGDWDFFKSSIRDYDRADGPEKLQERVRKVRSEKLAEAFGRGG